MPTSENLESVILLPQQATALKSEFAQFFDSFRPRERLTVAEWAEKYRFLEKGSTSKPGRYSFDAGPYQREPQESYTDPVVQVTVLMWASRTGKTETLNNLDGYIIDHDPKAVLVVYPTLDSATKWRKEFFNPMIRATPRLRGKINIKMRHSDNTMLSMKFPGGHIAAIGTNSPSGFRQIQAPVVRCDEIDAMEDGKEGDPISLAFKRADNYPDSIQVLSSTPTIKGSSRIEAWMERSDYRKWFCPCVKCGTLQVLNWSQVQWPEGKPEEAVYICENKKCGHEHTDRERCEMVENGEWRPTRPFKGIRGYWLNGLNTLFPPKKGFDNKLHQFVSEYLEAKEGGKSTMRTWRNTFLAETDDPTEQGEAPPPWKPLFDRREDYDLIVPAGGLYITADVDCQLNRLEVDWAAWGEKEEFWGMDHVVIDGYIRDPEVWQALRVELARKWKHATGGTLSLGMSFIDGGAYQDDVYRFFQVLARNPVPGVNGHCRASKGVGQHGHPIVTRKMMTVGKNLKGHHIGTWEAKDRIYERLRMEPEENDQREGRMHFNKRYSEEYFQQLTVETVTITFEKGQEIRKYVNPQQQRNEALDLCVGNLAAWRLHPKNIETLKAELAASIPVEGKKDTSQAKGPRRKKGGEWLNW